MYSPFPSRTASPLSSTYDCFPVPGGLPSGLSRKARQGRKDRGSWPFCVILCLPRRSPACRQAGSAEAGVPWAVVVFAILAAFLLAFYVALAALTLFQNGLDMKLC